MIKSRNFTDFFNRSSKFLEKVLDHGDGDMIELILREGLKTRDRYCSVDVDLVMISWRTL